MGPCQVLVATVNIVLQVNVNVQGWLSNINCRISGSIPSFSCSQAALGEIACQCYTIDMSINSHEIVCV